jgi:hypothetical protein
LQLLRHGLSVCLSHVRASLKSLCSRLDLKMAEKPTIYLDFTELAQELLRCLALSQVVLCKNDLIKAWRIYPQERGGRGVIWNTGPAWFHAEMRFTPSAGL